MDAKPAFNGFFGAFCIGEHLPLVFSLQSNRMFFLMGTLQRCGAMLRQFDCQFAQRK